MWTLDSIPESESKDKIWVDKLTENNGNILVSGRWLNDSIINAAQCLISNRFPRINGLQNAILGLSMHMRSKRGSLCKYCIMDMDTV